MAKAKRRNKPKYRDLVMAYSVGHDGMEQGPITSRRVPTLRGAVCAHLLLVHESQYSTCNCAGRTWPVPTRARPRARTDHVHTAYGVACRSRTPYGSALTLDGRLLVLLERVEVASSPLTF